MTYELKDYLKAINKTKEKLMDTDDPMWEKKVSSIYHKQMCFTISRYNSSSE